MEDTNNNVEICLNNEGQDYLVVVPIETANILLNDPEAAKNFIESQLMAESEEVGASTSTSERRHMVWNSKKPTQIDHEATQYFLQLRKSFSAKFDDKKTIKKQLWALIAKKMNEVGYYVGDGREAIEKCRMKFANMQKLYLQYIKHSKTTGVEHRDPPTYFDEIHDILGNQDKVNPTNLQDSLDITETFGKNHDSKENERPVEAGTNSKDCYAPGPSGSTSSCKSDDIKNRFSTVRTVKPTSANAQMLEMLRNQHAGRQENFARLEKILDTQNIQRERLLQQLQSLVDSQVKKRKRRDSDTSDSSSS